MDKATINRHEEINNVRSIGNSCGESFVDVRRIVAGWLAMQQLSDLFRRAGAVKPLIPLVSSGD